MALSSSKGLRGSCHCGRNQYVVQIPSDSSETAQILFDSDPHHRVSSATPLSVFLRVPLTWYHSRTFAFFPDEGRSSIRRIYAHPDEQDTMRHFCGFCGTPISYWCERPRSEADYIQLTLGSLLTEDLHSLEEMGLIPDGFEDDSMDVVPDPESTTLTTDSHLIGREMRSIPWFESMLVGSRLGNMSTAKGSRQSQDGRMRVEWEITEWTADGDDDDDDAEASESSNPGKRKRTAADDNDKMATA